MTMVEDVQESTEESFNTLPIFSKDDPVKIEGVVRTDEGAKIEELL